MRTSTVYWTAWGRNCFDFNWQKNIGNQSLCGDCEDKDWMLCNTCSSLVLREYYGYGYLPEYYDGDYICPECAEKTGFEIDVKICLDND